MPSSPPTPFALADGVTVQVAPPTPPLIAATVPTAPGVAVVPVVGPPGPPGSIQDLTAIEGRLDVLEADEAVPRGYVHQQPQSARLWQVHHGLPYNPGGVTVMELDGTTLVEPDTIRWPQPGVLELTFGVPFAGTATVS
jgi:hypothetical protein